jgi:hypothetical protein
VQGATGDAISLSEAANIASNFRGTITNNTIGTTGVTNSGSSQGAAISLLHVGDGTSTHAVTGNIIRQINGAQAILIQGGDASAGNGTMNVTVTGNDIQQEGNTVNAARHAIALVAGTVAGDGHAFCIDVGGVGPLFNNVVNFNTSSAGNDNRISLKEAFNTTVQLPGYTGGSFDLAAISAYLLGRNTASFATAVTGTFGFTNTSPPGAACPQP